MLKQALVTLTVMFIANSLAASVPTVRNLVKPATTPAAPAQTPSGVISL